MTLDDRAPESVLAAVGADRDGLLGRGGESWVYRLDANRVVRVSRKHANPDIVAARDTLLEELAPSATELPFAIPHSLGTRVVEGHWVSIERRIPGASMDFVLRNLHGQRRDRLIERYMETAALIGDLRIQRDGLGEAIPLNRPRYPDFPSWLMARAEGNLRNAGPDFEDISAAALTLDLDLDGPPAVVHFDYFPGNVIVDGQSISGVVDFGTLTLVGDRRFDPLCAAVYLDDAISPNANDHDRALAEEWLAGVGLADRLEAARRWLAAFWSAALDDPRLVRWSRAILLDSS